MPNFRKLSDEEVKLAEKTKDTTVYDELAQEFNVGEFGELTLQDGDVQRKAKKALSSAFKRKGQRLVWHTGLTFEVA